MTQIHRHTGTMMNEGASPRHRPVPLIRILFCLLAVLALVMATEATAADKFKKFKLKDLSGETTRLEDFEGKATLIVFFFPTCTYCNQALPETVQVYEKYRDQGLDMVWINLVDDEDELIPDWLAEHGYTVTVLVGASMQYLANRYDLQVTPTHFIVDADRNILFKKNGYDKGYREELDIQLKQALHL